MLSIYPSHTGGNEDSYFPNENEKIAIGRIRKGVV
jgi:hypothetical protein